MCPCYLGVRIKRLTSKGWTLNTSGEKCSTGHPAVQLNSLNGMYFVSTSPWSSNFLQILEITETASSSTNPNSSAPEFAPLWELSKPSHRWWEHSGGGNTCHSPCNGRSWQPAEHRQAPHTCHQPIPRAAHLQVILKQFGWREWQTSHRRWA